MLGDAAEYRLSDERRSMIEFLKQQSDPLTPKAISDLRGGEHSAVKKLLWTMAGDGQLQVDSKGRYSVCSNTGNGGNCAVNADGHGNPKGNSTSPPVTVVTGNGNSTVTDETMKFHGNGSPSYPVTTVTEVSMDEDEDVIAAERWAIEHQDSKIEG
jgi:hypothetical protein